MPKVLTFQIAPGHVEYRWGNRVFDARYGPVQGYVGNRWLLLEGGARPGGWGGSGPIVERSKQDMCRRVEKEMRTQDGKRLSTTRDDAGG